MISGRERRRRWSAEERTRILSAISAPGAVVAEVARREDVCTGLIYKWRREAREAEKMIAFAPVVVEASAPCSRQVEKLGETSVIMVEMGAARVRIEADAPTALIAATLKALRS